MSERDQVIEDRFDTITRRERRAKKIRMWDVTGSNSPEEIKSDQISREDRLENWLENDISMLDENLLVIGRQVRTDYGGEIDLLCIDKDGYLVVVELKRGKTPREVTAQALDYASWVKDLGREQIEQIASNYLKPDGSLEEAFHKKFGEELPGNLNEKHRSLIVAESMDPATERIVHYLSEMRVPVNVATVQYFKVNGRELLAHVFLVDPEVAEARAESKRPGYTTLGDLSAKAKDSGVASLYEYLRSVPKIPGLGYEASYARYWTNNLRYHITNDNGSRTVMFINVAPSDPTNGLKFHIYATRFNELWRISVETIKDLSPEKTEEVTEVNKKRVSAEEEKAGAVVFTGAFSNKNEIRRFFDGLHENRQSG